MSETNPPYSIRIKSAGRYYAFQEAVRDLHWIETLQKIESEKSFGIPEILVLLDPKYYQELGATDPRGERTFAPATQSAKCRAMEVWGYVCPFQNSRIHVDHMFPQSKGGSTHLQNAMYLCEEHNMSKHTDIHLILWEKIPLQNDWVTQSIKHLLGYATRITNEKLYFPISQVARL
jgi:hypothetical protein